MANELSLVCFDFKLQSIKGLTDDCLVSKTDYGSHLVDFIENVFQTKIKSTANFTNAVNRVWNETLCSTDGKTLVTLRLFDRSQQEERIYKFLVTLTIETFGSV